MHRQQFTLEITDADWVDRDGEPSLPTITITVDDESELVDRLDGSDVDDPIADEIDVTVRLYEDTRDEPGENGVVAVTDRMTGEYLIEVDTDVEEILSFVTAARRYGERTGDSTQYCIRIVSEAGETVFERKKQTLLVYSGEGELLRGHSLIPSGVEI